MFTHQLCSVSRRYLTVFKLIMASSLLSLKGSSLGELYFMIFIFFFYLHQLNLIFMMIYKNLHKFNSKSAINLSFVLIKRTKM